MSKHITEKQRYAISKMLQVPMSKKDIAEAIGVDRSNIYREIKRNCDSRSGKYNPDLAQRKADKRKVEKKRKEVFTQAMKKRVKKLLRKDLSPEQIVGRSQVENIAMVSHETIYCWIWQDKRQGGDLHKSLRRQGRKYSKRGSKNAGRGFIPNRVEIDQRPSIVEQKERFGDLEIDTIIGKNHKGAILTINDRATSRVWIRKLSGKEAIPVAKITVWALRKVKNLIHTITADNGKEFAKHEDIAQKLDINFYFCKPYHSWERGANENTNGLIRQYIPKGTDFSEVTNKRIKWIENNLNNRPRKCLFLNKVDTLKSTIMKKKEEQLQISLDRVKLQKHVYELCRVQKLTINEVRKKTGLGMGTIYRYLHTFEEENPKLVEQMKKQGPNIIPEDYKKLQEEVLRLKCELKRERLRADFYEEMVAFGKEVYGIDLKKAGTK